MTICTSANTETHQYVPVRQADGYRWCMQNEDKTQKNEFDTVNDSEQLMTLDNNVVINCLVWSIKYGDTVISAHSLLCGKERGSYMGSQNYMSNLENKTRLYLFLYVEIILGHVIIQIHLLLH